MTDMEQQQKEVRKKALKLLEHMDRTEKGLYDRLLPCRLFGSSGSRCCRICEGLTDM